MARAASGLEAPSGAPSRQTIQALDLVASKDAGLKQTVSAANDSARRFSREAFPSSTGALADIIGVAGTPSERVAQASVEALDPRNIARGVGNAFVYDYQHPLEVVKMLGSSAILGAGLKMVLPESGPVGLIAGAAMGGYFLDQSIKPMSEAVKQAANGWRMTDIHGAAQVMDYAAGSYAINSAISMVGYNLGTKVGSTLKTQAREGFAKFRAGNGGNHNIKPLAPETVQLQPGTDQLIQSRARVPSETDSKSPFPSLPDRYRAVEEEFDGKKITGISPEFIKHMKKGDDGLPYPDLTHVPDMAKYMLDQNTATEARVDSALRDDFVKAINEKVDTYTPPGWDDAPKQKPLHLVGSQTDLDVQGEPTLKEGSRTFTLTDDGAPNRKLVAVDQSDPKLVKTIIAQPTDFEMQKVIKVAVNGTNKFAVIGRQDGATVLHVYGADGNAESNVPLPGYGVLREPRYGATETELQFLYETPSSASRVLTLDLANNKSTLGPMRADAFNSDNFVTEKIVVPYADREGKMQDVPVYVSHGKNLAMNGRNPLSMSMYGGFNEEPYYLQYYPNNAVWMERGGVVAAPVLPGDGGRGSGNYELGLGAGMENTNLAAIAVTKKLQEMGFASPESTGTFGVSNGGTHVNSLLNMRPDLFGAAVSESGVDSIIDSPKINVGAGKSWQPDFGDPSKPRQVSWMSKLDVLSNLSKDKKYPPTLIGIGTKDDIVNAGNGITYADIRQGMNNGETLLYFRLGEGHQPEDLSLQSAFLWSRLTAKA